MLTLTIFSKNAIIAILYLILFFFGISALFIFCGADYMGILFLLLYAGAISIIFLFVVMFIDSKELVVKKQKHSTLIKIIFLTSFLFLFYKLIKIFYTSNYIWYSKSNVYYLNWAELLNRKDNMEAIGYALYNYYLFQFIALGFVLFLVMILIISLLINYNKKSKKQNLSTQLDFEKKNITKVK